MVGYGAGETPFDKRNLTITAARGRCPQEVRTNGPEQASPRPELL